MRRVGHRSSNPPPIYVGVAPILQKRVEAQTGPKARANAPRERKIPKMVPFWLKLPYFEVRVVMQVTTNAVAKKIN